MTASTWRADAPNNSYSDPSNWTQGVPNEEAVFSASVFNSIAVEGTITVESWDFTGAEQFFLTIGSGSTLTFQVGGITGAAATGIDVIANNGTIYFLSGASAWYSVIANNGALYFYETSSAGSAIIENNNTMLFSMDSSAGSAQITNKETLYFWGKSTAKDARIINDDTNAVTYFGDGTDGVVRTYVTGSIEGNGTFALDNDRLTVGSLGGTQTVTGVISGLGSITKVGTGTLILSGANTYTGSTTVSKGVLELEGSTTTTQSSSFSIATGATLKGHIIFGGNGRDVVTNKGTFVGSFDMGPGNDAFTGTGGSAASVFGGVGNDTLIGGSKADALDGGANADKLTGGAGKDGLIGGLNADDFIYSKVTESRGSARDTIMDFSRMQGDDIWLNAIDANTTLAGNQAFSFIGSAAFSRVAGQLRYQRVGSDTHIMGDVNGDRVADIIIISDVVVSFIKGDFVL